MRNAIKEFVEYSDQEKLDLWDNATFIFDTNVFLNLYRYSNRTRVQLIESFEHFQPRIWMPYQVAFEFCRKRYTVIDTSNNRFEEIERKISELTKICKEQLRLDESDSDLEVLSTYINDWVEKKKNNNYMTFEFSHDYVFETVMKLFDGRTGREFSDEEKNQIEQEGKTRYEKQIPPGYKDRNKEDNKYGDLFVWKEILRYAKEKDVDVVFVTHDQKEDWWNSYKGKTIGPRVELRKEFYNETNRKFHMYTMSTFLEFYNKNKASGVDVNTLVEVEDISTDNVINEENDANLLFDGYAFEDDETINRIESEIAELKRKNKSRVEVIEGLSKRSHKTPLTHGQELLVEGSKRNLLRDRARIKELKKQLKSYSGGLE